MLEVKGVNFSYNNESKIAFDDFQLKNSEHCLLLGKSGSGKTTLLHLIGGLLTIQEGTIKVGDTFLNELKGTQLDQFRGKNVGFVFQKPHLLKSISVIENILLAEQLAGKDISHEKAENVLEELGIINFKNKYPTQLSHGQLQRVAVARALVNDPVMILADEPTASLDDENADTVLGLLIRQSNKHNASLVIATHDQRVKKRIEKCIEL